jgi:hypothetical protein
MVKKSASKKEALPQTSQTIKQFLKFKNSAEI